MFCFEHPRNVTIYRLLELHFTAQSYLTSLVVVVLLYSTHSTHRSVRVRSHTTPRSQLDFNKCVIIWQLGNMLYQEYLTVYFQSVLDLFSILRLLMIMIFAQLVTGYKPVMVHISQ